MNNDRMRLENYDIPIRTLSMSGGANKILPGAAAPKFTKVAASTERMDKDSLNLLLLGHGKRCGDGFQPPCISYAELYRLFDGAPIKRYSARNPFFGYREETGRFISLDNLVSAMYGDDSFILEEFCRKNPDASITVSSGGKTSRISALQVREGASLLLSCIDIGTGTFRNESCEQPRRTTRSWSVVDW